MDSQQNTSISPLDFFRTKAMDSDSRASTANMMRAIDSLSAFLGGSRIDFDSFDESMLGEWIAYQIYNGYRLSTASYNLSKIAALYNKAVETGLARPTESFKNLLDNIKKSTAKTDGQSYLTVFNAFKKIINTDYSSAPHRQLAKDIFVMATYNGGLTFKQIGEFRKDDYRGCDPAILEIIGRWAKPRKKYLFPLNQSTSTPRQLERRLAALQADLLEGSDLTISEEPGDTARDTWCAIAMTCGIPASEIATCIAPAEKTNALTAFVKPANCGPERIREISDRVVRTITDDPVRWYAMHFRRGVTLEMIENRLEEKHIRLDETYYPMEEILHKIGKRKVFKTQPVISWLMFFRTRASGLNNLYSHIGDLAWGYRTTPSYTSPYATVSPIEINEYRRAIGTFDPNDQLFSHETIDYQPGDRVLVIGGPLSGRPAICRSANRPASTTGRTICEIELAGGMSCCWIVKQDAGMLRKITDTQFAALTAGL